MSTPKNPVEGLFPEETPSKRSAAAVLDSLNPLAAQALAYDDEIGPNPGYIFRGELDFKNPLQTSLEVKGLQAREKELIEKFVNGEGGRIASLIDRLSPVRLSQPKDDIFWWLSLMRHHRQPTRLLDFTRDIRMAQLFAVAQHDELTDKSKREDLLPKISSEDMLIYCLPCWHLDDARSNKTPFDKGEPTGGINMNRALGCVLGLHWMEPHKPGFDPAGKGPYQLKFDPGKRPLQLWGWDRSCYQIPRIEIQKGMLVYPFDDYRPDAPRPQPCGLGGSWFVSNICLSANYPRDSFNMGEHASELQPKRIRIPASLARELKDHLKRCCQLTPAIAYLDYERVELV